MGTDHRADGRNENLRLREAGGNQGTQLLRNLRTVAMPDYDLLADFRQPPLFHAGEEGFQSLFLSSWLSDCHQLAAAVHMDQGLNAQDRTQCG